MPDIIPLTRTKHHVTIEFDIDVASELVDKIKDSIAKAVHCELGYPGFALNVDYSFNNPEPPKTIEVRVKRSTKEIEIEHVKYTEYFHLSQESQEIWQLVNEEPNLSLSLRIKDSNGLHAKIPWGTKIFLID